MKQILCAGLLAAISASAASAATTTSLVGDIDGFGGQTAPGAIGAETGFGFDNNGVGDPAFTDVWLYEQNGGAGGSPITYTHSYAVTGTVLIASLAILESGMSDNRGPWEVSFNGNLLGLIENGAISTSTEHVFDVDVSWLTGNDLVTLTYLDDEPEGFAIDYSKLSIEMAAVPVPAAGLLMLGGLGLLGGLRRRKTG